MDTQMDENTMNSINNDGYGNGTASGNELDAYGEGRGNGCGKASGWGRGTGKGGTGWKLIQENSTGQGRGIGSGIDLWTNRDGYGCGAASGRSIRLTHVGLYRRTVANGNGLASGRTYTDAGWEMY